MSRKKKNTTVSVKLTRWQKRLADSNAAYSAEVQKMDERERIYNCLLYTSPSPRDA